MKRKLLLIILSAILGICFGFGIDYLKHGSFAFALNNNPNFDTWKTGLVGYWTFDGQDTSGTTIYDLSGNSNNGTASGTSAIAGIVGQGRYWNGIDDRITVNNSASFPSGTADAIEVWIKISSFSSDASHHTEITSKAATVMRLFANQSSHRLSFYQTYDGVATSTSGSTVLLTNTWYHIVGTYNGANTYLYVNGILDGSTTISGALATNTSPLLIGVYGGSSSINGIIDELRIYNRYLSSEEVKEHYSLGARKLKLATPNPANWTNGLVGYWTFNGQDTILYATATDISGNDNNGTLGSTVSSDTNDPTPKAGVVGQALSFDGVDDYVNINHNFDTTTYTIEAWIKIPSGANTGFQAITSEGAMNNDRAMMFLFRGTDQTNAGKTQFLQGNGITGVNVISLSTLNDDSWHHLVGVFPASKLMEFFIDGKSQGTSQLTGTPSNIGEDFTIGATYIPGNYFNGLIDEVRVYNRALSAAEVKQHYEQTRRNLGI